MEKKGKKARKKRKVPIIRNRPKFYSKFPLQRHVKNSLEFLKKNRDEYTYDEIRTLAPIKLAQVRKVEKLEELLKENPKIAFNHSNQKFRYQPKFAGISSITGIKQVLLDPSFLVSGVDSGDMYDAYEGVNKQVEEFKRVEQSKEVPEVYFVYNKKTKSDIMYHNPERYRRKNIHAKLKEVWGNTIEGENFPRSGDLVDIFLQNQFKRRNIVYTGTVEWVADNLHNKRKRQLQEQEGKKVKRRKLRKITNVHLLSPEEQEKYYERT